MKAFDTVYLGDGLYASCDGCQVCLAANDADYPTDRVFLDEAVLERLSILLEANLD